MKQTKNLLAFDFGASSGRAVLGRFDGEKLTLEELHRFSNDPVKLGDTLYWDVLRLFYEIKQSLLKAKAVCTPDSIGIDTWGVDFGLLDADEHLLENPVHYRDTRTAGIFDRAFSRLSKEELYRITGNQLMEINTVFQLAALREARPALLEQAQTLLFMPDLFSFMLTDEKHTEYSIASTSQLLDAQTRTWSPAVLENFGIPRTLLPEIVPTATPIGTLHADLCEELGISASRVIAVAGHDTQLRHLVVARHRIGRAAYQCANRRLQHHQRGRLRRQSLVSEKHHRSVAHTGNAPSVAERGRKSLFCRNGKARACRARTPKLY